MTQPNPLKTLFHTEMTRLRLVSRACRMFLMSDVETFIELLRRVRLGEPDAAYELVRQYEMDIRIAVRARLSDPALRQQFDSMDICQSVLASFFLRRGGSVRSSPTGTTGGLIDSDGPEQTCDAGS